MKDKEIKVALSVVEEPKRNGGESTTEMSRSNEVSAKASKRRFTLEYKRRILKEADACTKSGEIGALLRREGLYSSMLSKWRLARDQGEIVGLRAKKRGPKQKQTDSRDCLIVEQQRQIIKLKKRAERAEALVEIQKKVSQLLGIQLSPCDEEGL